MKKIFIIEVTLEDLQVPSCTEPVLGKIKMVLSQYDGSYLSCEPYLFPIYKGARAVHGE